MTILMALHNGVVYLPAQFESLMAQSHTEWRLAARDDGSRDGTADLLDALARKAPAGRISCLRGERVGHAAAFLKLLAQQLDDPGWLAFADQDDVWLPGRLTNGLALLSGVEGPALTAARVLRVGADLSGPRVTGFPQPRPSLSNALVENIAPGNTILANPAAARLLVQAARRVLTLEKLPVAHDWWAYQMVTAGGGSVIFDPCPAVLYRQHAGNAIGANAGARAALARLRRVWTGTSARGARANLAALLVVEDLLTPEARALVRTMEALNTASGAAARLRLMREMGLYRQSHLGTLALWAAAALGKL